MLLDPAITLDGRGAAVIEGKGSVSTITGTAIVGRGLEIRGSGSSHETIDSGVQIKRTAISAVVEGNRIVENLHGVAVHGAKDSTVRGNLFRDLRFAVHYMHTNNSVVSDNVSIGNHLGYALMYANRITVHNNKPRSDHSHGLMPNFANNADTSGNLVRGGTEKCTFIGNAYHNLIYDNRFEGCQIGIHFTAGSEKNTLTGNAFIGNRNIM